MRLLFDQNLSPRIIKQLTSVYPDSQHVRYVGLEDASDSEIYEFARDNDYIIVTFDSDFVDLNTVRGIPPKIIWMRTGNMTTKLVTSLLIENSLSIQHFMSSTDKEILEILKNPN